MNSGLLLLLATMELQAPAQTADAPSLALLEYIGAMEQTDDGSLVDPLDMAPPEDIQPLRANPENRDDTTVKKRPNHENP